MALTYAHLFDLVRKERASQELQEFSSVLYEEAGQLFFELASQARLEISGHNDTARIQLSNSRKLLRELYDRREQKILLLAQNRVRTGSALVDNPKLIASERVLFDKLVRVLSSGRSENGLVETASERTQSSQDSLVSQPVVEFVPPGNSTTVEPTFTARSTSQEASAPVFQASQVSSSPETPAPQKAVERVTVRVTKAVAQFMGSSMETYGPFEENELVELPNPVAQVLIRRGTAQPGE